MLDLLITTFNRRPILQETVESFLSMNTAIPYRLFIIDDCSADDTPDYLRGMKRGSLALVILRKKRSGITYAFNALWNVSEFIDRFYEEYPYLGYLQDDMKSLENEWLLKLIETYEALRGQYPIGFFSGHDAFRHPPFQEIQHNGTKVILKKSQGFTNMIAEKSFWRSIGYVPRLDLDGRERGFPGNGKGSNIDLYFTGCMSRSKFVPEHAAKNCLYNQGKFVMVIPGMLEHMGEDQSTWR